MNRILCIPAVLSILLNVCSSFGQTLYPMTPNASVTITSCEGLLMDDGGSTSNYAANQTSTVTICSSNAGASPMITFNLALFDIHTSDILNVRLYFMLSQQSNSVILAGYRVFSTVFLFCYTWLGHLLFSVYYSVMLRRTERFALAL